MQMETLRELYIEELKDLYSAEKQLVKALPKMAKNATTPELKDAFSDHLEQTKTHVERLERIFETLEARPGGKKCVGMEGLIEEANELIEEDPAEDVLDAGLVSKAQHVEHYEIAGYGTVRSYALFLGENDHASLLQQTLDEEIKADKLLTLLAEAFINTGAVIGDRVVSRRVASDKASGDGDGKRRATTERSRQSRSGASAP